MKPLALLLALLFLLVSTTPTSAHATLVRADPPPNSVLAQSPSSISLWFDENLDPQFSAVTLLDPTQASVDLHNVKFSDDRKQLTLGIRPNLPPGAYTVSWRALSAVDGHITKAVFAIFVGAASAGQTAPIINNNDANIVPLMLDIGARWLNLLAALALCGALTLNALMSDAGKNFVALRAATARRMRAWVVIALIVLFVGTLNAQLLQAAAASDRTLGDVLAQNIWFQMLTTTRFGQAALVRIVLVDALLLIFAVTHNRERWRIRRAGNVRALDVVYVMLAAFILLTFSLSSHAAASVDPLRLALIMDWLHLVAIGAWTGGLFALAVVVSAENRTMSAEKQGTTNGKDYASRITNHVLLVILRRFSKLAIAAVAMFAFTGLYSMWRQVGYPSAFATAYGETLVVKTLLVIPLLMIGAINTLLLRPGWTLDVGRWRLEIGSWTLDVGQRIVRALSTFHFPLTMVQPPTSDAQRPFTIFYYVRLEALLGAVVVLAAATMTALPPARSAAPPPAQPAFALSRQVSDVNIALKVDPPIVGNDTFEVRVSDAQGRALANVTRVNLRFTFLGADLGTGNQEMHKVGDDVYRIQGGYLSVVGVWKLETLVRRKDVADDLRVSYRLNVMDPLTSRAEALPNIGSSVVFAILDLLAGLALLIYARRKNFVEGTWLGMGALVLGVVLFALGTVFAPPASAVVFVNPIPPDDASLADGKRIYEQHCAACHGVTGRGNGPLAASLNPRPADFVQHINFQSDDILFNWISDGVDGTAMAGFKDKLNESERWNVLNYAQSLGEGTNTPTASAQTEARALLTRSDAAMNQLKSMSVAQRLGGDTGLVVTATYHYVAPDKLQFTTSTDLTSIAISRTQYYLEPGKAWEKIQRAEPLRWPQFDYATQATDVKLEGEEIIDGEPCAIVVFRAPNVDYFRHWIGERTHWLRKQQMEAPGHHMGSTFAQFDEPFVIRAPSGE